MPARAFELNDLARVVEVGSPDVGPGGAVAYVRTTQNLEDDRAESQIWLWDGTAHRALTPGPRDTAPRWVGNRVGFLRTTDESTQAFLLAPSGDTNDVDASLQQLTSFAGSLGDVTFRPDGGGVAAIVTDRSATGDAGNDQCDAPLIVLRSPFKADGRGMLRGFGTHLHIVDEAGARQLIDGDLLVSQAVWNPAGTHVAVAIAQPDDDEPAGVNHVWIVDATDGTRHRLDQLPGWSVAPVLWLEPSMLLCTTTPVQPTGRTRLCVLDTVTGEARWLFDELDRNVMLGGPGYPGARPQMTANGDLVFAIRDGGHTHLWRGGLAPGDRAEPLVAADGVVVGGASLGADGSLVWVAATPTSPGDLWRRSSLEATDERCLTSNNDWLAERDLHLPERFEVTAPDGTIIEGWTRGSRIGTDQPLLVDLHGGPHNAWTPAFGATHLYHQILAARGWLVLTLNPRGSDGYGEAFHQGLVRDGWGQADELDVMTAIDTLIDEGIVDRSRIAVAGYSYGGYLTSWLIGRFPDRFAAAIAGGVVSNRVSHATTADIGQAFVRAESGRGLHDDLPALWEGSPIAHLSAVRTPTLILQGGADDRCPMGQAEELFAGLRDLGVPTQMAIYPGATHGFIIYGRPSHRIHWQDQVMTWLDRHVPAGPPPPAKAVEAVDRFLTQATRLAHLGAFITIDEEHLRAEAADLDARPASGPVAGMLVGVKDCIDTAGIRTTNGANFHQNRTPSHDATVVRRLRAAGALVAGKTNLAELALGGTTQNPHHGACRNPWDPDRIPGGSSGGSAVAVATGMLDAALGTDTGGSIRNPAAMTGIVGLRPTVGSVPTRGVLATSPLVDTVGPLARDVRTAAEIWRIIAGPDATDPSTVAPPTGWARHRMLPRGRDLVGLRVGVLEDPLLDDTDSSVAAVVTGATDVLAELGARMTRVRLKGAGETQAVMGTIQHADAAMILRDQLDVPDAISHEVRARLELGRQTSAVEYAQALDWARGWRHRVGLAFVDVDVIVTPTCPITAPRIDDGDMLSMTRRISRFFGLWSLGGNPSLTLPCGFVDGLPVGLLLAAAPWREARLLHVAAAYEDATDWHLRRPATGLGT